MVLFHSADKSLGFHIYQTVCLQECTQPGTVPVVMVLQPTSMNKTAFSSIQRDHTLCKYIIITFIERRESCCSDSEVDKYSRTLECDNAVEWHWMETARPSDKSVNYVPTYTVSHPKDLKPCGANICLKSRQLRWS
jgi:succinate dehydrogenase flavin-adding protein (antitoxin of CptAB toxin-antitoxin module)